MVSVALPPGVVSAQTLSNSDKERAEAIAIEAKAFFKSGLYSDAATGFMRAYAISKRPDMMFNAARAYEEAKMPAQAVALFEQYLQLDDAPEAGKREARERIVKQRRLLNAQRDKATAAESLPTPDVKPPEPKPSEPKPSEPKPAEPKPSEPKPVAETKDPVEAKPVPRESTPSKPAASVTEPADRTPSRFVSYALFGGGSLLFLVGALGYAGTVAEVEKLNQNFDFGQPDAAKAYRTAVAPHEGARSAGVVFVLVGAGLGGWGAWRLWGPAKPAPPAPGRTRASSWLQPRLDPVHGSLGLSLQGEF